MRYLRTCEHDETFIIYYLYILHIGLKMKSLFFITILLSSLFSFISSSSSSSTSTNLLSLSLHTDNSFTINVNNIPYFQSADTLLSVKNTVYSIYNSTLTLQSNTTSSGEDGIGNYNAYILTYTTSSTSVSIILTYRVYAVGNVIGFSATFLDAINGQPSTTITDNLALTFPTLAPANVAANWNTSSFSSTIPTATSLGSLVQDPNSGNCGFTVTSAPTFPSRSAALLVMTPNINSDSDPNSRISFAFSSVDHQPVIRQGTIPCPKQGKNCPGGLGLAAGPGLEFDIPAGFTYSTILVATTAGTSALSTNLVDFGFPMGGPNDVLYTLGNALLDYHGKTRPRMNFDITHSTLGYSVCAFYFYNPCDCGKVAISPNMNHTCSEDTGDNPYRLPNCMTYEDTLLQVHNGLMANNIPYHHMLIDSWWYGENIYGGVNMWEDDPTFMASVETFPNGGLRNFSSILVQDNVVLWAHMGRWVSSSPYLSQYEFYPGTDMPQGRSLWDHLYPANKEWNLVTTKLDHVAELIAASGTITNVSQISEWLGGMGESATDNNIAIQYCCSPPLVLHNSLNVPAASGARSSPDYVQRAGNTDLNLPLFQWANGVESAFHYSIGLMPDKDTFYSNHTQKQHGGDGKDPSLWPSFYNWTEVNPVKHALSAVMCGGPVAPGDAVNSTNMTLVYALMRQDGEILRPSRPHSALDVEMRSIIFGSWPKSSVNMLSNAIDSMATQYPNKGLGELYSTVSLISGSSSLSQSETLSRMVPITPLSMQVNQPCMRYTFVYGSQITVPVTLSAFDLAVDTVSMNNAVCNMNNNVWVMTMWDLNTFRPYSSENGNIIVQPIFNNSTSMLAITVNPDYADLPNFYVIAPVINQWVVLGENLKMVPISPQRITYITANSNNGIDISIIGSNGELVTLWACPIDSTTGTCSSPAAIYSCTLPSTGTAVLQLPGGTCNTVVTPSSIPSSSPVVSSIPYSKQPNKGTASPGPLPRLNINGPVTVSGISSGADFVAQLHLAYSDIISGSGIFAGQPPFCAIHRYDTEPVYTCANEPKTNQGPGCVGLPTTGAAPCEGCAPGTTVRYDHCKQPALPEGPGWVQLEKLFAFTNTSNNDGLIAPLTNLANDRVYLYRGTKDSVYLDGSVNKTMDFFANYVSDPSTQIFFEANIPSQHCFPTNDPWLSNASCGQGAPWAPPAIENCNYDGAGAVLQFVYNNALTPPTPGVPSNPNNLYTFNQNLYMGGIWGGIGSYGFVYIPPACLDNSTSCRLHVAFHGCGMSVFNPQMNTSFALHTGFNPWADKNNFVILYPQGGGYQELNMTAPSAQIQGGCWDGYGQTGLGYSWRGGPQMVAIANMIQAIGGSEWYNSQPGSKDW